MKGNETVMIFKFFDRFFNDIRSFLDPHKYELLQSYFETNLAELWENCILESIKSVFTSVYKGIVLNIIFGLLTSFGLPGILFHWLSTLLGVCMLFTTVQSSTGLIVVFVTFLSSFFIICFNKYVQSRWALKQQPEAKKTTRSWLSCASCSQYGSIVLFVLCEYLLLEKETWLEIRGIMMVFSMKLTSLIADLPGPNLPGLSAYFGYMFCPGNILFGPWISFEHYMMQVNFPTRKNLHWLYGIIRALMCAVIFVTISNCWASYFISEDSNSFLLGYQEALSFRSSHYFVCYLSEAFMIAGGYKDFAYHFEEAYWKLSITNVWAIELPMSLAVVATNWNKPMHEYLKKYVYRLWLPSGKFRAVLLTFVTSSLFHGLELKVSTVLVCLGVFSYLQILVRDYISQAFDICVKVYPCKSCQHEIKRDSIVSKLTLLTFSLFTALHLVFLGVLMDESAAEVGIFQKWNDLYFCSLWIMFVNFLLVK
uniref:Protein-serine O-palmitoleoyltransferase porcupine n=1 Tax=Dendroctonus ponderosae TaxID=77166 RepID=A0AAR5PWV8_DENPD